MPDKQYIVSFPSFDVEANSLQEAVEQAVKTFLEYSSSQNFTVREFGNEHSMHFNLNSLDGQVITEN